MNKTALENDRIRLDPCLMSVRDDRQACCIWAEDAQGDAAAMAELVAAGGNQPRLVNDRHGRRWVSDIP